MKTRITSAAIGLAILSFFLFAFDTFALNIGLASVAAMAVFELLRAVGVHKKYGLLIPCIVFSEAVILFSVNPDRHSYAVVIYLLIISVILCEISNHGAIPIKDVMFAVCMTLAVTFSFQATISMRDIFGATIGKFYFILILSSAWLSDAGAYFTGLSLGRHKLCPQISPKKTVEGFVGGVITGLLGSFGIIWVFQYLHPEVAIITSRVLIVTPVLVVLSVCGDLAASIIKRQCGIKDYGSIMPGHGGVMDRFDSVLPVASAMYIISVLLPLISAA